MGLRLNREALRVVGKNEKGTVTHRRRFKKGDKLDKASLDILGDDRVQHFLDRGVLVDEDATEDTDGPETGSDTPEDPQGSGEATGEAGGTPETDGPDKYDEMSYADLQAEAKERTGNGGGSADDLRARLREQDTLEADDED